MVTNTSFNFSLIFPIKATIIALLFILVFSPSYCLYHKYKPQDSTQGLLVEEKTRLGSTPPSCYNKCNQCHPCMAVQVPTIPSHHRVEPSQIQGMPMDYFQPPGANRYSNYKPLGWKCRCGDHFYNP
ncbi:epidermal patterning factor-like protein 1 [Nicotiana attenuata]|uniref:Epidermal patterning factor-like protein n=1 Tax=Nicotiana attenuata TaxID=49451 RepID=A0A314KWB6_NICAT|nr:epidermal patterning factor-like protein 1 [Nicotiana attenuata]